MPEDFIKCQKGGGRMRTVTGPSKQHDLKKGEYRAVCFDKDGMHQGEVKKKQSHYQSKKEEE